ncbi:MAG: terminase small subunit protein, partial [Xanthobacteraceae bacterium]
VCRWLARNAEFRYQYVSARALQMERFGDEMLKILDDGSDLRVARRRIGALKLVAARLTPKKYGGR